MSKKPLRSQMRHIVFNVYRKIKKEEGVNQTQSMILKRIVEWTDLFRRILEWRGWTVPSRLSYSAYLMHVFYIRNYVAFQTTISHTSLVLMMQVIGSMVVASLLSALPLWLIVEAPAGNLIREFVTKLKKDSDNTHEGKENGTKEISSKKELTDEKKRATY